MEKKRIPTEVYSEITPNPETMKFVVNRALIEGKAQAEFKTAAEARKHSPLASELFNFPFVKSVFISSNSVTVTKDESLGWEMIVMQMRDYLWQWLSENEVAVTSVPERTAPSEDGSKNGKATYGETEYDDQIKNLLDEYVRPAVERDGGAIDFKAFHEGTVYVELRGSCSGCPSSMMTLKGGIENLLKSEMEVVKEVVAEEL